jgi:hypothetical protein
MSVSAHPDGNAVTVKEALFTGLPFTVTVKGPVDAPDGTVALISVSLQLVTVALVPLSETVLLPRVAPKPVPEIETPDPTAPEAGDNPLMRRLSVTVKLDPLLFTPLANTTTFPVVAPLGTVVAMLVALQLVTVAGVPSKVTVLEP